jgi:hypothetical protein
MRLIPAIIGSVALVAIALTMPDYLPNIKLIMGALAAVFLGLMLASD